MRKKTFWLMMCLVFSSTLLAQEIDSLYAVFLASNGEEKVSLANRILVLKGDSVSYTMETPVETMNDEVLKTLIFWHFDRSEMTEVVSYSKKAIEKYERRNDLINMAGCYNMLGIAYQRLGHFEEAIDSYDRSHVIMARINEQEANPFYEKNIRYTINNMAAIYSSMGEYDQAEEMYVKCIGMLGEMEEDQDYRDKATYLQNLADVYLLQAEMLEGRLREEKIEKAVDFSEQALGHSLDHDDRPNKIIQRMMVVSRAYFSAGKTGEAIDMLGKALQLAEDKAESFLQAEIETLFGKYNYENRHYKVSERHYQKAIAVAKEGQFDECLLNAYRGAYQASKHFDLERALDYYEQSVALKDSIFSENQQRLIREYQVKYDLAEKEHDLEIQIKNNQWQTRVILAMIVMMGLLLAMFVILIRLVRIRKKQNKILARLNKTQNRIFSAASHDVKTSILAQNMVLKLTNDYFDSMGREEVREKLAMLKIGSDELKDRLYTILHWIYSELGTTPNPPEAFDLASVVDKGVNSHAEELEIKGLKVVKEIPDGLQCFDKVNIITFVFQNLFSNAIKFSLRRGEIKIRAVDDGDQVWVEVIDQGVGISQDRLEKLMYETTKSTGGTDGETGMGIGLFVSRQLMVKNGGQLIVDSVEGQGTTARFNVAKHKS